MNGSAWTFETQHGRCKRTSYHFDSRVFHLLSFLVLFCFPPKIPTSLHLPPYLLSLSACKWWSEKLVYCPRLGRLLIVMDKMTILLFFTFPSMLNVDSIVVVVATATVVVVATATVVVVADVVVVDLYSVWSLFPSLIVFVPVQKDNCSNNNNNNWEGKMRLWLLVDLWALANKQRNTNIFSKR